MKKRLATLFLLVLVGIAVFAPWRPSRPNEPAAVEPGGEALRIHRDSIVIDLHVDALIWPRDLNREGDYGHLDFPRMRRGGIDAAAFTIPTRFFRLAGLKAMRDGQPPRTWFSPWERYRHQVEAMRRFITSASGTVRIATSPDEIRRNHREGILSVLHGIEGAHALEGDLSRVSRVATDGVVFIGIVHLWRNDFGAGSFGPGGGLTDLGRALIEKMNEVGLLVDLAHAGPKTFDEALERTRLPPIVSHTGARTINDTWRNLSDDQIRAVAKRKGVIGVMVVPPALDQPDLNEAFRHLAHIVDIGGEECAAIGSDFDGYWKAPIDATGLPQLTELMVRAGWSEGRIKRILGENVLRVLGKRE
jgi:microsomal dipeptidase-like Zn-dependent dipeptidase